jgi:hypothetical protein
MLDTVPGMGETLSKQGATGFLLADDRHRAEMAVLMSNWLSLIR